jgi:hypothetical protein
MARTFNGTNDSIEAASAPVTAVPLTIACWFYPTSSAGVAVVALGVSGGSDRFQMSCVPGSTPVGAASVQSGVASQSSFSGTASLNQWHHAAAVFASSTSRTAYFNGSAATANTTASTPTGINRLNISGRYLTTLGAFFQGAIAEVGVWNAALNADEITSLSKGFPCRLVRPSALVFYSRLIQNVMDIRNGVTLSELGTGTTVSDHPRIIYPC